MKIRIADCYLYREGETYALQLATKRAREAFPSCSNEYKVVDERELADLLDLCDNHALAVRYFV